MKKIIVSIMMIILIAFSALAEEETTAGVTPDSALWGIDRALESISLALTFNTASKAEKRLLHAQERLEEIKILIEENNVEDLEKAQKSHQKIIAKVEEDIDSIDDEDVAEQLEMELEIEEKVKDQKQKIMELKIKIKGQLTAEQQAALDVFLATLGDGIQKLELKITRKRQGTTIKVREELGEDTLKEIEGTHWQNKAENEIAKAQEEITKAESKIARFEQRKMEKSEEIEDETEGEVNSAMPVPGTDTDEMEVEDETEDSETGYSSNSGSPTGQIVASETEVVDGEVLQATEVEEEMEGNVLTEYNLVIPDYPKKSIESARSYVADAKTALTTAQEKWTAQDFKAAYAYAKFSKKLAQRALEGDNLNEGSEDEMEESETDEPEDESEEESDSSSSGTTQQPVPATGAVKEFSMIAKQWSWEPATITVQQGDTVKISINNVDVPHGFSINALDVDEYLAPGITVVEFVASKKGTFEFDCSISCGSGHGDMEGTLIVE